MNTLNAITTFHLNDQTCMTDENMKLESINEHEFSMSSIKKNNLNIDDVDFVTVSMIYGNFSRLLFSCKLKSIITTDNTTYFIFNAPEEKVVKLGCREIVIPCTAYEKLRAMLKPRIGKSTGVIKADIKEVIDIE